MIAHQRDERRNDDCGAFEEEGGELVAEALAATGRGDQEQALLFEESLDGFALPWAKGLVAELSECRVELEARRLVRFGRSQAIRVFPES